MPIPAQHQLLDTFRAFLSESGLSKVSVKNYVSDVRKFLEWTFTRNQVIPAKAGIYMEMDSRLRGNDSALPTPEAISKFVAALQDSQVPHSTINRYLASLRRYSVFLKVKYEIDTEGRDQSTENKETSLNSDPCSLISATFLKSLQNEDLSHSTIKNYKSDLNHFLAWSANTTPSRPPSTLEGGVPSSKVEEGQGGVLSNLSDILNTENLDKYQDHLKIDQTSSSVINRRISTLKKFVKFALVNKLISSDPFTINHQPSTSTPLALFHRHSRVGGNLFKNNSLLKNLKFKIENYGLYRKYNALPFVPYLHLAILVLFVALLANFGYDQIVTKAVKSQAYPASPTRPTRQLSFQGRLTDSSDTPITVATDVVFKLYNALSGGSQLYTSGTCSVTPDQDGIFNTLIGDTTCGAEIDNSVFSENQSVYLEVTVGASTLTPRQQIATVGFALNTETLQGYPVSSTASATRSTVAVMNQYGEVILGEQSPILKSVSGTFNLQGQTLSLSTATTTNGNINLSPDGTGSVNAIGGATSGNFLRITDANLTSGNLISGYVGNDTATGNLLSLSSGSVETTRLAVATTGQTTIDAAAKGKAGLIINQLDSGPIFAASASGTNRFLITNAGNITLNQATIIDSTGTLSLNTTNNQALTTGTGVTTLGGNLVLNNSASTTTFGGIAYTWPTSGQSSNYVLATNGTGTLSWNDASLLAGSVVYWNQANGSLFPKNSTVDAFIGGQATASAKFAFLNVNSGTPTASISGTANRSLVLDAFGNITTTAKQSLTLGDSSTGNIILNAGNVGIGTTVPAAKLDVSGSASVSGNLNLYAATPTIQAVLNQNLVLGGDTTGSINFGSNVGTNLNPKVTSTYDLGTSSLYWNNLYVNNIYAPASGISGYWQRNSGAIAPANLTDDLLLGTTATSSALVKLPGISGGNVIFNSGGNVGIGTTAPGAKLEISSSIPVLKISDTSLPKAYSFRIGSDVSGQFDILDATAGVVRLAISTSGNVGIGTTNPLTKFHTVGSDAAAIGLIAGATKAVRLGATSTYAQIEGVDNTGTATYQPLYVGGSTLDFTISGSRKVSIDTSGNVGIGTTAPTFRLDVYGSNSGAWETRIRNTHATTGYGLLVSAGNDATNKIAEFRDVNDAAKVTILGSGNVGIGTTGPNFKTEIYGNVQAGAFEGLNIDNRHLFDSGSNYGTARLSFSTSEASYASNIRQMGYIEAGNESNSDSAVGFLALGSRTAATLTEKMRITSQGNVGIGTTAPGAKLVIYDGRTRLDALAANNNAGLEFYSGGTETHVLYRPANTADLRLYDTGTGDVVTFKDGGNVGIGTTGPNAKLEVSGTGASAINTASLVSIVMSGTTNWGSLRFTDGVTANAYIGYITGSGATTRLLGFANNSATSQMVIDGNGNVGIGTTGPGQKLTVSGDFSTTGAAGIGVAPGSNSLVKLGGTFTGGDNAFATYLGDLTLVPQNNWKAFGFTGDYTVDTGASNTITNAYNFYSGGITKAGTGTITNTYGLYISAATSGTNNYGLYTTSGTTVLNATSGNVGIGTTGPSAKLHVVGNCVTGDTLLPIKRRRKKRKGDIDSDEDDDMDSRLRGNDGWDGNDSVDDFDEFLCPIRDIQPEDQVLSLNEATGTLEYSKINKLMDMGIKQVFELTTKSGRVIRTTAEHPYLTLLSA